VEVESAFEIGPKTGTPQAHTPLKITHYTNSGIDNHAIKDFVTKEMGLKGIHINTKLYRNANDMLEEYIRKTV
jgi:hypothetical protein